MNVKRYRLVQLLMETRESRGILSERGRGQFMSKITAKIGEGHNLIIFM